jgi:PAS domain-containing protein
MELCARSPTRIAQRGDVFLNMFWGSRRRCWNERKWIRQHVHQRVAADRDGIIGFWNPGAVRLFGYSHDEAMSRSLDLIIPERLRQRHWNGYRRVIETGKSRYGQGDVLSVPAVRSMGLRCPSSSLSCRYKAAAR